MKQAEDTMLKYEADAAINGLVFDRHEEAKAVEAFANAIKKAAQIFIEKPNGHTAYSELEQGWLCNTGHTRYAKDSS